MDRIRQLRQAAGWTQAQLGKRIGVVKTTVSGYESGDRQPDIEKINALCDLFHVSADYLLGRSDTPLPVLTDEDARILAAYHAADERDREYIDHLLRLDAPEVKREDTAS